MESNNTSGDEKPGPDATRIRARFRTAPMQLFVPPDQLGPIGVDGKVLRICLKNGCEVRLGPYETAKDADEAMLQFVITLDRSEDRRPTPMTKEDYLHAMSENGWTFPYVGAEMDTPPPADWIAAAWDLPEVQNSLVDGGILRDYSKGHGLACSAEFLAILSASLRREQVADFYLKIRRMQPTREDEFRSDFLAGFAAHAADIPPALTAEQVERACREEDAQRREWQQKQANRPIGNDDDDRIPF